MPATEVRGFTRFARILEGKYQVVGKQRIVLRAKASINFGRMKSEKRENERGFREDVISYVRRIIQIAEKVTSSRDLARRWV